MTKIMHLRNEYSVLYLFENNPWMGKYSASQAEEHSFEGIVGKRASDEGMWKQGVIDQEIREVLLSRVR